EEFMDRHGYKSYRDFRDAAVGKFTSADKLTLHGGYAEVDLATCNGCGLCEKVGHCNAIAVVDKKSRIDREKCLACSTCVDICPKGAISMVNTGKLKMKV
ncbi:MAG: 4Fe-4S binding protein, partial [Kiritimatiellia bacterium]